MVILRKLIARDFKHLNIELDFPEGILSIGGPNESGKSSIFEAILYAFFGRTNKAPRGEKERLINYDAKELFLRLVFELQGKQFRITRRLHETRPTVASLHEITPTGRAIPRATGVREVERELSDLLDGVSLKDMMASNVVLQKDLDHLAKLIKSERRAVINAMMGRECFTRASAKLADETRPLRNRRDSEFHALESLRKRKEGYHELAQELDDKRRELEKTEKRQKEVSRESAKMGKLFKTIKAYKEAKEKRKRLQHDLKSKINLREQLAQEISRLTKLKPQQKHLKSQQERFTRLDSDFTRYAKVGELAQKLKDKLAIQTAADGVVQSLEKQLTGLESLRSASTEYERVRAELMTTEDAQRGAMSPLLYIPSIGLLAAGLVAIFINPLVGATLIGCSVPFLALLVKKYSSYRGLEPRLAKLRAKEQELSEYAGKGETIGHIERELEKAQSKREKVISQVNRLVSQIRKRLSSFPLDIFVASSLPPNASAQTILTTVESVEQKLQGHKTKNEDFDQQLSLIQGQLEALGRLERDQRRYEADISDLKASIAAAKLLSLPPEFPDYSETQYDALEQQVNDIDIEKAKLQTKRQETVQRIEEISSRLERDANVEEEYTRAQEVFLQLEETLEIAKFTRTALSDVAERSREQVRPSVEQVMGPLLAAITGGKYHFPKLSEDYSLKVWAAEASEFVDADRFSGGTEDQFLLALRLSFAITLLGGRGTAPQFLFLDEPFAASDTTRRNNIITLLQETLTKSFKQIIVVSHLRTVLSASEHHYRMINGRIIPSE